MTDNPFGYVDFADIANEQQARLHAATRPSFPVQPIPKIESPLADLDYAIPEILSQAAPPRRNVVADAAIGAAFGGMLGHLWDKRRARKAQELEALKRRLGVANVR